MFSQVGDYHGSLETTMPSGISLAGRHPSLLQGARSNDFSHVRDLDYGDEAYDLRTDTKELNTLIRRGQPEPPEVTELRRRVDAWGEDCLRLQDELGVVPRHRAFDE